MQQNIRSAVSNARMA